MDTDGGRVSQAHHSGSSVGGKTFLLILPQERAVAAMVGNMSQAPPHWAPTLMILEAFLDPEALTAEPSGPDVTGVYECSARFPDDEVANGAVEIRGSPAEYWGREVWDDEPGRFIYSSSRRDATTLISVDQDGVLSRTRFTSVERNRLTGERIQRRRSGEVTCRRR